MRKIIAVCVVGIAIAAGLPMVAGSAAVTSLQAPTTYYSGPGYTVGVYGSRVVKQDVRAGFPALFNDGRGKVWLSYARNRDLPTEAPVIATMVSTDRGATFRPHPGGVNVQNAIRGAAGQDLAIAGHAQILSTTPRRDTGRLTVWRGPDWRPTAGSVALRTPTRPGANVYFNQGIIRYGSSLLAPYYGRFAGDVPGTPVSRVELASSTDGVHWRTKGTIAKAYRLGNGDRVVYSETSVIALPSGGIMAVMRREQYTAAGARVRALPLVYSISIDGGRNWNKPAYVRVAGAALVRGARPLVQRMPDGNYMLGVGRPDNRIVFARGHHADGSPRWTTEVVAYRNFPTKPAGGQLNRDLGSSGYVAMTPIGRHTMLTAYDNCAPGWGCPAHMSGWVTDARSTLVVRRVAMVNR